MRTRYYFLAAALCVLALIPPLRAVAANRHQVSAPRIVMLDPGHGGTETGAVDVTGTLVEKTLTLEVAKKAATDLEALGYRVYLTRTSDQPVNTPPRDLNHDGKIDHVDEFDARTLAANRRHADVFVSIHFDGSTDPTIRGTHGYYCPARPFWRQSQMLADDITSAVTASVRKSGYDDVDAGVETDVADVVPQTRADYPWFLVLGPSRKNWLTGTAMPGALIENLFLSSPRDTAALRKPATIAAIAQGYAAGIHAYFAHTTR